MTKGSSRKVITPEALSIYERKMKLNTAFSKQHGRLKAKLGDPVAYLGDPVAYKDMILRILQKTAIICKQKIEIGSPFKAKTFGKDSVWYKACHLLYARGHSDKVPEFFRERIPDPSQSTAGASSQGRESTLFGGTLTDTNAADIVTRRRPIAGGSVTGGSVTGGSRKRRRT